MERLSPGELPITPEDKVLAYLPMWREYRGRYQRTEGHDARVAESWRVISEHMDSLIAALMHDIILVTPVEEFQKFANVKYDAQMDCYVENYGLEHERGEN